MPEKILFVSSKETVGISLALYNGEDIFKLDNAKNIDTLYNYLSHEEIDKIGFYKQCEEPKVLALANELMIPVISVSDIIENSFPTDILPADTININNTANYIGIKDKSSDEAFLTAQIYRKVIFKKEQEISYCKKIRTHK